MGRGSRGFRRYGRVCDTELARLKRFRTSLREKRGGNPGERFRFRCYGRGFGGLWWFYRVVRLENSWPQSSTYLAKLCGVVTMEVMSGCGVVL